MHALRVIALAAGVAALAGCQAPPPAFKEYAYPAWGFAVSFRAPPKVTDYPASADGKSAHTILVEAADAGRDELVNVIDGSGSSKTPDQALADAPGALAAYVGGAPGPITYVATGKTMGREFLMNRPGQPASRVRVFAANRKLYEVIARSSLGPDDPEIKTFLDSFRLL